MSRELTAVSPNHGASQELAHPAAQKMPVGARSRGITPEAWHVMSTVLFKGASEEMICTLVDYCKARRLDPLKRPFHIVKVWDSDQRREVESIWPGIGELRTTAMRTGNYAGKSEIVFGPDVKKKLGNAEVTFPEWAQCSVFRIVNGIRVEFSGSRVYWLEAYAKKRDGEPNAMWSKRPRGQLAKCAEAEALRSAFPEELGHEYSAEEMEGQSIGADRAKNVTPAPAIVDPAETVEVTDQHGQVEYLDPLAVAAWAAERVAESTDDELDELFALNSGNAAIRDAVTAETLRRKGAFSDEPPAVEPVADPKEARRLYKVARDALAVGDHAAAVKARLEAAPHLDELAAAKFDELMGTAQAEAA